MACRNTRLFHTVAGAAALALVAGTAAYAGEDTRVALVPGGPHPYFAAWEDGGRDAVKDFALGAADYKVPTDWQLSLQNELIESLVAQGYNSFLVFPGDAVGTNSTLDELADFGIPSVALAGHVCVHIVSKPDLHGRAQAQPLGPEMPQVECGAEHALRVILEIPTHPGGKPEEADLGRRRLRRPLGRREVLRCQTASRPQASKGDHRRCRQRARTNCRLNLHERHPSQRVVM